MNAILENLLEKVDGDGWCTGLLSEIVSFFSDPNVSIQKVDYAFTRFNTIENPVITTKGWDVQVQLEDQLTDWVPISLINKYNMFKVDDHVVANGYNNEPAFCW